jgi:hypothetical protein
VKILLGVTVVALVGTSVAAALGYKFIRDFTIGWDEAWGTR